MADTPRAPGRAPSRRAAALRLARSLVGAALVTLTWSALGFRPAMAVAVVLLRAAPLAPYEAAARGFRTAYSGEVLDLTMVDSDPAQVSRRILAARPGAVVAIGGRAARFARDRLPNVPIVFCGLQGDEARTLGGAWVTGVSVEVPPEDELDALRLVAPGVRRIGVVYGRPPRHRLLPRARAAASARGLVLIEAPLARLSELPAAARDMARRVDAWWLPADPTIATPEAFRFLLRLSLAERKPLLVFSDALVRAGALTGVSPDFARAGARAADSVRKILAGKSPGQVSPARVRDTRVVVNESTARALGIEITPQIRARAEVIP